MAFSCLVSIPTWLNEGLAVYAQGGLDATAQVQLREAIAGNTLLSVHTLSGAFSEIRSRADLSYSESYSLVNFLIKRYGAARLRAVFGKLSRGSTIEQALRSTYGFGLDGLEARWRASIRARPPRQGGGPAVSSPPTPVPTYPPLSGVWMTTQHARPLFRRCSCTLP